MTLRVRISLALWALVATLALSGGRAAWAGAGLPADLVILDAKVYTANAAHDLVEGFAVRRGRIVFAGTGEAARSFIGPKTRVEHLQGRVVLPGLFDSHLHSIAMIKVDSCDLATRPMSLRELSAVVGDCVARYPPSASGWLNIHQWNPTDGNQPDEEYPTLAVALDKASTRIALQLIGTDGHHGAYNHVALARARNAAGQVVGFSRDSLARDFAASRDLVGVDESGAPNGAVNESAKALMGAPSILLADLDQALAARAQLPRLLNAAGITGILDAKVSPEILPLYDALERDRQLTFRASLAQFYDPEQFRGADGQIDYARMVARASEVRARYARHARLRADTVKLFADGVLEGNPYAVPPTPPNSLALRPYLQPIFGKDVRGELTVTGYADPDAPFCREAREQPASLRDAEAVRRFTAAHGFHPGQCVRSTGTLRHDRATLMAFVERFHRAGFTLHIHAIGDGAVRAALDALEAARASDGVATQHDALAHVQLVHPDDVARIGRHHLYVAFTYSWANADPAYDMTVVPFIDQVSGGGEQALFVPSGYYEPNVYPFRAVREAGGILVAGSDAPVNTRDPQPFVNMAGALTRRLPGRRVQNPAQALGIREVLDAYTRNAAQFLNRPEAGSLEVGKSADFIVVDRDILSLGDTGRGADIAATRVLATWFEGHPVYVRDPS